MNTRHGQNIRLSEAMRRFGRNAAGMQGYLGASWPEQFTRSQEKSWTGRQILPLISGLMFHYNCENKDFESFSMRLDYLGETYGDLLRQLDWVSLGGGIYFTLEDYPLSDFSEKLKVFSERFGLQIYLEPGEAVVTGAAWLVTQVLDVVSNEGDIALGGQVDVLVLIQGHAVGESFSK